MEIPKYQYHVLTWGGFYNDEYKAIHGLEEGDFFFDSKGERDKFIRERKAIEKDLQAHFLMIHKTEGYNCHIRTICHRIVEIEGKQYYSTYDLGINYPFSSAVYMMNHKWYIGCNDYPLGEDFDYDSVEVKYIKEWVTGAFDIEEEE